MDCIAFKETMKPVSKTQDSAAQTGATGEAVHPDEGAGSSLRLVQRMRDILTEKKGEEIVVLDMREVSGMTDFFVLVSGMNPPHLKALAGELEKQLKREGIRLTYRAGTLESHWIVLDYIDVVVHVFLPEVREYYNLERLWKDAPQIE